jgi:hypothetical protein
VDARSPRRRRPTFVRAVHRILVPCGYFMIYDMCPPQSEEHCIPRANGRSPFQRDLLESVGFEIVAYNRDDTAVARDMGKRLAWADQMTWKPVYSAHTRRFACIGNTPCFYPDSRYH